MPSEIFTMANRRRESEGVWRKEFWLGIRQLGTWLINISGKSVKRDIKPEQLFKFADEEKEIDVEKRQRESLETWKKHKRLLVKNAKRKKIKPTKEMADETWKVLTGLSMPKKEDK